MSSNNGDLADETLGSFIMSRRKKLNLTRTIFAGRLGVTRSYIGMIESNVVGLSDSDERLSKIAKILNLDVETLKELQPKRRLTAGERKTEIGAIITFRRQELKLTQMELADRAGLAPTYINCIENGRAKKPSLAAVRKIGDALGFKINTVVGYLNTMISELVLAKPQTNPATKSGVHWRECECICHDPSCRAIHFAPCCSMCIICGRNIDGDMNEHIQNVHAAKK